MPWYEKAPDQLPKMSQIPAALELPMIVTMVDQFAQVLNVENSKVSQE